MLGDTLVISAIGGSLCLVVLLLSLRGAGRGVSAWAGSIWVLLSLPISY